MSDEILLKVLERLEAIEARLDPPAPVVEEEFPDWNEDPESIPLLKAVPDSTSAVKPTRAIHRPGQGFAAPLDGGLISDTEWVAGEAKIPSGIVEGVSSGHRLTEEQLARSWQKDMIAPMRQRPVEDAV